MEISYMRLNSKMKRPFIREKGGVEYEGENWLFECNKKDFTYDEAWEQCNKMIERMKETENYDTGFIHKQYYTTGRHKFGVILGKEIKGETK